ncbi:MAG TPA: MBL fold metallo-hydrolase [Thermoleophilia bacterium]|nr:MBL fold metallo-hydrolase [Thermoleophilia bacterium]
MEHANPMLLEPVETVEILVLMDNFSDVLLSSTEHAVRPPLAPGGNIPATTLLAEHGLSLLITVRGKSATSRLLLDAGYSDVGVPHNLDLLGVDLSDLEALVLSHGHMDHFGALGSVLQRVGEQVPVVAHPAALEGCRYLDRPGAGLARFVDLPPEVVASLGSRLRLSAGPYVSPGRLWATTGEVARETAFEKGMPGALRERDGRMVADSLEDDTAVVVNVGGKGLVVISGCAHAGIVNTVRQARDITGVEKVYALVGGFHLGGATLAEVVDLTVEAIREFAPQVVVPMHCTGRAATQRLEGVFGDAFEVSSVGTMFRL